MARIRLAWAPANVSVALERDVFLGLRKQPEPGAVCWLLPGKVPELMVFERDVFLGLRKQPEPGAVCWLLPGAARGSMVLELGVFLELRRRPAPQLLRTV